MTAFLEELDKVKEMSKTTTILIKPRPDNPVEGEVWRTTLPPMTNRPKTEPYLAATMLDAQPIVMEGIKDELGPVVEVVYSDPDQELIYTLHYHQEPTLYIKNKKALSVDQKAKMLLDSISDGNQGSRDLNTEMMQEVKEEQDAHLNNAVAVTEGGMKKLINAMRSGIQARQDYLQQ